MIADQFISEGYAVRLVLSICKIPRSTYYNRKKPKGAGKRRGIKNSTFTITEYGEKVSNTTVVDDIKEILQREFVDYGYLKVTYALRQEKGYIINPKKVYRLMRETGLLNKPKKHKKVKREWVKDLKPNTIVPFDYLEFDIKYEYVSGKNRNALTLTIICVNTRMVLGHYTAWKIKQKQVKGLFDQIFENFSLPQKIAVRCDNGSQFIATEVQEYFKSKNVLQEFCKPATPEQNGHIESYHSIVEKVVCRQYEFDSLDDLRNTKNRFVKFYNYERIHSGTNYTSPYKNLENRNIIMDKDELKMALDCSSLKP